MRRNLGRQSTRAERTRTHLKLDNQITEVKSLLTTDTPSQTTKDLKAQLKDLQAQKKEAGKSPRHSQAPSNRFNVPIPKIQGLQLSQQSNHTSQSPPVSPENSESNGIQEDFSAMLTERTDPSHHYLEHMAEESTLRAAFEIDRTVGTHAAFDFQPFDVDSFLTMLDKEPIPGPTAAEMAAHQYLRAALGK